MVNTALVATYVLVVDARPFTRA